MALNGIYYTWSKTRLIENAFTLTPALTLTLILTLTKWRHFSIKCSDTHWMSLRMRIDNLCAWHLTIVELHSFILNSMLFFFTFSILRTCSFGFQGRAPSLFCKSMIIYTYSSLNPQSLAFRRSSTRENSLMQNRSTKDYTNKKYLNRGTRSNPDLL